MRLLQTPKNFKKDFGYIKPSLLIFLAFLLFVLGVGLVASPKLSKARNRDERQDFHLREVRLEVGELRSRQELFYSRLAEHQALWNTSLEEFQGLLANLTKGLQGTKSAQEDLSQNLDGLQKEVRTQGAALAHQSRPDQAQLRHQLRKQVLSPVVQLTGNDAVGSAVLVHRDEDSNGLHYLALTSYHVIRDILSERADVTDIFAEDIQIIRDHDSDRRELSGRMLVHDAARDLALLRIHTAEDLGQVAAIAPLRRAAEVEVFTPVYTVGCPLGTAAQATRGEVTRLQWEVDGQQFWMVSSPAYFGNSGGGVFLEDSHELIGIFAKIYTHGSFRPQVVTHMGLAVPLGDLHQWLKSVGQGHILN